MPPKALNQHPVTAQYAVPRWEMVVRRIIKANIDRLKLLLKNETDPAKRAMEARLLAGEEAKLKVAEQNPDKKKAY